MTFSGLQKKSISSLLLWFTCNGASKNSGPTDILRLQLTTDFLELGSKLKIPLLMKRQLRLGCSLSL